MRDSSRNNKKRSAVEMLQDSPTEFFLGGSRKMAERFRETFDQCDPLAPATCPQFEITVTEDTDYDFYATHSPELETRLLANGFDYSTANEYYLDSECITIMCKDNVQVVLRVDAYFYKSVFDNIDLEVYYRYMWKSSPEKPNRELIGRIFNMLFNIAHATKGV